MTMTPELQPHNQEEKKLYQWLRNLMKKHHVVRIENTVGSGMPDVNICTEGYEAWIELKIVTLRGILLRKEQYAWGVRRAKHQGRSLILSYDPQSNRIEIWIFPQVIVEKGGKYLRITNKPYFSFTKGVPDAAGIIQEAIMHD